MTGNTGRFGPGELGLVSVEDDGDVLVVGDMLDEPEVVMRRVEPTPESLEVARLDVVLVVVEGVLRLGRRLPLVAPDHIETDAIEGEMEASNPREQLGGGGSATARNFGRVVVLGHVEPFTAEAGGDGRIIPDLAVEINLRVHRANCVSRIWTRRPPPAPPFRGMPSGSGAPGF